MTRKSPTLKAQAPEGYVEISPDNAEKLGVNSGEDIKVKSRRGEILIKASVTDKVKTGVVFIPFHFVETAASKLTVAALDPKAEIPELKVCAVRLEKP